MSFEVGPAEQTGWGHLSHDASGVTVNVACIDTYCQENGIEWIDVLKVDVEGADAWVHEGAAQLLGERRIGTVFFEHEPQLMARLGIRPDAAEGILASAGYRIRPVAPHEFMATCPSRKKGVS